MRPRIMLVLCGIVLGSLVACVDGYSRSAPETDMPAPTGPDLPNSDLDATEGLPEMD